MWSKGEDWSRIDKTCSNLWIESCVCDKVD